VTSRIERGDLAGARAALDEGVRRGLVGPRTEKLRGDLACARRAPAECVRRYRLALAGDPELREDERLRENARTLLIRSRGCADRRAAAELLGELRDARALPALRDAKRTGGIFAFLCTGDAIDRAIEATWAAARE
jgi:eukaryotic-like serine/threonine-protein kinase